MRFHSLIPRRSVACAPLAHPSARAFWPAEFDRLFDEAWRGFGLALPAQEAPRFAPRVDVTESDEAYTVRADLPGLEEKDIQVSLEEGVLTIQGKLESEKDEDKRGVRYVERASGSFHRSIELPAEVDAAKVTASYRQGVLTVTLPKRPRGEAGSPHDPDHDVVIGARRYSASWKMIPSVVRSPERTTLTPCRICARENPRGPDTGRSRVANRIASPCASAIASPRDCMRGRCSSSRNSPPVKSAPGFESRQVNWSGKATAP